MNENECEKVSRPMTQALGENRIPTTREKILQRKKEIEQILADTTAALEALDEFPQFERIHDLLTKTNI